MPPQALERFPEVASFTGRYPTVATPLHLCCAVPRVGRTSRCLVLRLVIAATCIPQTRHHIMLIFPFGNCGNVHTARPAPSPGVSRDNQCRSLCLRGNYIRVESAMIASLPRTTTAATTTITLTATTWPATSAPQSWMLHAYSTDTAPPATRHLSGTRIQLLLLRDKLHPRPPLYHPTPPAQPQHESLSQDCTPCFSDCLEVWVRGGQDAEPNRDAPLDVFNR